MVNETDILYKALQDDTFLVKHIDYIYKLEKIYPYFQPVWAAKTRFLKIKNTYAAPQLQQTAARSIDRELLFEYLEKPENRIPQVSKNKRVQATKTPETPKTTGNETKALFNKVLDNPETKKQATEHISKDHNKSQQLTGSSKKTFNKPDQLSYIEWLQRFKTPKAKKNQSNFELIDKFLKERPKIVPKKNISIKPPDIVEKSVAEKQMLMTETLANLYVKQKKYEKAIQAFRILSLKYPKKSSYFANQIKEIKQKLK